MHYIYTTTHLVGQCSPYLHDKVQPLMGGTIFLLWGTIIISLQHTWVFWSEGIHMLPLQTFHTRRPCHNYQGCGLEDYDHLVNSTPCDAVPTQKKSFIWEREPQGFTLALAPQEPPLYKHCYAMAWFSPSRILLALQYISLPLLLHFQIRT